MSTMIKLGVGDDAIEVEDGARVPLLSVNGEKCGGDVIATVGIFREQTMLSVGIVGHSGVDIANIDPRTGAPPRGRHWWRIDLAALRRERAPKVETVGGWATHNKPSVRLYEGRASIDDGPTYFWTHRPGNSPEKQAAFDAALDAWMAKWGEVNFAPPDCEMNKLIEAARTLGYGAKR